MLLVVINYVWLGTSTLHESRVCKRKRPVPDPCIIHRQFDCERVSSLRGSFLKSWKLTSCGE
jgi:hypothetical protein